MAEYLVQEESLTAIADAIRATADVTAELSLAEMVTRITGLKASKLMSGTVTSAGNGIRSITVNHGLGVTPNFALFVQSVAGGHSVTIIKDNAGYGMSIAFTVRSSSSSTASHTLMTDKTTMNSTSVTFAAARPDDVSDMLLLHQYKYLIGVI